MTKLRWIGLSVVVFGLALAVYLYNQKPKDVAEKAEQSVKILQDTVRGAKSKVIAQVDRLASWMGYVKKNRCVMGDRPYEVWAYKGPDIGGLTCMLSSDGKSVKTLIYPKARLP